ncbi:uncharacterized protein LTR77_009689 [Saxophila tyrrhenica]|uniref:DUF6594 domain-containing protein n=1 Tax=Saxophila tyrrhenica TaxID=1690608 RepID=A0AAV9P0V6_9PEZI|nr:hypothetical protein LTR77_009689 [Saxophila tyrrhenica]
MPPDEEEAPNANDVGCACRDGAAAISQFLSYDPDQETLIFRRFDQLAARNLLHLQSELTELEIKQAGYDRSAAISDDHELQSSTRDWARMRTNAHTRAEEKARVALGDDIEMKLERYYNALLLRSKVARFERPSETVLQACRLELLEADGRQSKYGCDAAYLFGDGGDLISLGQAVEKDTLSRVLRRYWPFQTRAATQFGHDHEQILHFEERSLAVVINLISIVIASILLIGSILLLYFVTDPDARLALVIMFIVLFAACLAGTTGASRDSIFAATAAYTAVLVVFVSGDLGAAKAKGGG